MVIEKIKSRSRQRGEQPTITLEFTVIRNDRDDAAAEVEFLGHITASFGGLPLTSTSFEPVASLGASGFLYDATATYSKKDADEPDVPIVSFDTTGGTQHIQVSKQTVGTYGIPSRTPPNFNGLIGVTKDSVDGVDIVVPNFSWTEEHKFPASAITQSYVRTLEELTGRTNDAPFRGRAIGEALFMGATGTKSDALTWPVTFKFAASRNVSGVTIGEITGIAKGGWEYLWVSYEDFKDVLAVPPKLIKRPVSVHVERVYDSGNYSGLGIGTT